MSTSSIVSVKIEGKNIIVTRKKCAEIFQIIDDELLYVCLLCSAELSSAVQFDNHFLNQHYFDETIMQPNASETHQPNYHMPGQEILKPANHNACNDTAEHKESVQEQDFNTIECLLCKEIFYCNGFLDEHNRRVHNIEKPYKCAQCLATFGSSDMYKIHLKLHEQPNLTCMYCRQIFDLATDLDMHLIGKNSSVSVLFEPNTPVVKFQCSNWDESQATVAKIKLVDKKSFEMIKINYDLCNEFKEYDSNTQISHALSHHTCLLCRVQFTKHEDINQHRIATHSNGKSAIAPMKWPSPNLLPVSPSPTALSTSKSKCLIKQQIPTTKLPCLPSEAQSGKSPLTGKHKSDITAPIKRQSLMLLLPTLSSQKHKPNQLQCLPPKGSGNPLTEEHKSEQQTLQCSVCNKNIKDLGGLKRHLLVHSGEKPHLCSLCGLRFNRRSRLNEHVQRKHHLVKPHKCVLCPKAFSTKHYLQAHVDWHNQKRVSCTVCGKSFFGDFYLKKHNEAVHNADPRKERKTRKVKHQRPTMIREPKRIKNYPCDVCSIVFQNKTLMYRHVKSVHKDYNRYTCKVCSKVYSKPCYLLGHMDTHTNTKHKCHLCDKSYFGRVYLDRHYAAAHKVKDDRPSIGID